MKFIVDESLFSRLPHAIFGVVTAYNLDNTQTREAITADLAGEISLLQKELADWRVKEHPAVVPYREAFLTLNINPNKFMPSLEALMTRVQKSGSLPYINPLVDLVNSISLRYRVPMGAHDLASSNGVLMIRPASAEDTFIPFGQDKPEAPEVGETVYVSGHEVRTRRWIWRQSEIGKVTAQTQNIFIPIDGFAGINEDNVREAVDRAAAKLQEYFGCSVYTGLVDHNNPVFDDGQM